MDRLSNVLKAPQPMTGRLERISTTPGFAIQQGRLQLAFL